VIERQPFRASRDVWSGSSVTISSAAFAGAAALPAVLLDELPLAAHRIDDTTLIAPVPDTPGPHYLRVVAKNVDTASIIVYLRGFVGHVEGPFLSGRVESGRDPRHVFGNGPTSLRRWNIATNKAIDYPDSLHAVTCTRGVGPSPTAGDLVLLTGGCTAGTWMVWRPEPLTATETTSVALTDFVAVLRSDRWIVLNGGLFSLVVCESATVCTSEAIAGLVGTDVVRSRRGDRAALLARPTSPGAGPTNGMPVVDVAGGAVAYRVPALSTVQGAAFTPDGDTLFLAGDSAGAPALTAVFAADGARLATRTLGLSPCAVAVDGAQRWLYVAGLTTAAAGTTSVLQVLDRATLNVVTTLQVTGADGYADKLCRIVQNPVESRVYVVTTWAGEHNPAVHAQLYSFETPR
ncbi:MAG TPA: hypothetical protein VKD28_13205, partial [Gemmatimonadales bacterium]|nr:hypothetical protein [Gemmatimonadales bacterium]